MPQPFRCILVTPERQVLDEPVSHVSIPAWDGQIGLKSQRAPLVAKLGFGSLEIELQSGETRAFFVGGGFAQMKDNELSIVTDEATPADAIDRRDAEAELRQALEKPASGDDAINRRQNQVDRARARAHLAGRGG
ncbi:MAG: ATP synthase F1 subunit epsilon [Phycisphaeraceae bacterium]